MEFIDPSGKILDGCTGEPLEGTTVTLQKNDSLGGDGYVVPDPREHIPATNPQITAADGFYAWAVVPGRWRVQASKPGYEICDHRSLRRAASEVGPRHHAPSSGRLYVPPLAGDDANGGSLQAALESGPAHGSLTLRGGSPSGE